MNNRTDEFSRFMMELLNGPVDQKPIAFCQNTNESPSPRPARRPKVNHNREPAEDKEVEVSPEKEVIEDLQKEVAETWENGKILVEQFNKFSNSLLAIKSNPHLGFILDERISGIKKFSMIIKKTLGF